MWKFVNCYSVDRCCKSIPTGFDAYHGFDVTSVLSHDPRIFDPGLHGFKVQCWCVDFGFGIGVDRIRSWNLLMDTIPDNAFVLGFKFDSR